MTKSEEIKSRVRITDIYKPQKGKNGGILCPLCGSGEHGDGAFHIYEDTNTFHCFSCGAGSSVIDLYMRLHNVDFNQALKDLGEKIGQDPKAYQAPARKLPSLTEKQERDYTQYYKECRERLFASNNSGMPGLEYIEKRGLDLEVCCDYMVGYDPNADPAGKGHPTPRLIIPITKSHYIGRALFDERVDKAFRKMNSAGSTAGFFNVKTLNKQDTQEVFICEAAIDALSFLSVGVQAIGLNSADNAKRFIKALEAKRPSREITFIIALDNDADGKKWGEYLAANFRRLGLTFIMGGDLYGKAKDANEALCSDRAAFVEAVDKARKEAAARPDNVSDYISFFMGADMEHFKREIPTGYKNFDEATGGLYPGLYVVAAISSLGKTAWALQLADQLAANGFDTLFFSLEMSRLELVSRSISRTIALEHKEKEISSMDVRKGRLPKDVLPAVAKYSRTVGHHLSVIEENFEANISTIGDYVRKYIAKTGTRPVVIIDYLQIIAPMEDDAKRGKREAIDSTTTELKRLSRELDAPMIVISSVNRANYSTPIALESLKESGNIEYSADVVLGMQLQCLNEDMFSEEKNVVDKRDRVEEEKGKTPRKIEMKILKNRYGATDTSLLFDYYPKKDLFIDMGIKKRQHKHRQMKAGAKA